MMAQTLATDESTALLVNKGSTALQYGLLVKEQLGGDQFNKSVSFHNISYEISQRSCCKRLLPKTILDNVSGIMKTGLNAIMGPTGSGKTSLLDILAGHKDKKGLSGVVLINGEKQPVNFKCKSAYVVQDDVVMGTLSVRENITFSAALRLPSRYTGADRKERVWQVIEELGLTEVADSKVGTEFIRGISGGEKKRTSIGMELIIAPGILFLDEPTTGLDASTAISVIRLLKDLSKQDRVIIISIHQPRYSIYKLFDTLTLLSKGNMVYHGLAGDHALQYFSDKGYECEQHDNPADFFLDVVISCEAQEMKGDKYSVSESSGRNKLAVAYTQSSQYHEVTEELTAMSKQAPKEARRVSQFASSFPWQLGILAVRAVKNLVRNPIVSVVQMLVMLILSTIVGVIYFQLKGNFTGFQNRVGAFYFVTTNIVFGSISALELFINERPLFIHQSARGYYRVSAFFFAKVFCDLLPMRIIPVIFYSAISYWMLGLKKELIHFGIYSLTLLLVSSAASATAFLVSAGVRVLALAAILVAVSFVFQMIFGGFLVNLNTVVIWLSWIQYISIFRFSLNALFENELKGSYYCNQIPFFHIGNTTIYECDRNLTVIGDIYLESLGYLRYNIWYNELGLFLYITVVLTLAYTTLRCVKKER